MCSNGARKFSKQALLEVKIFSLLGTAEEGILKRLGTRQVNTRFRVYVRIPVAVVNLSFQRSCRSLGHKQKLFDLHVLFFHPIIGTDCDGRAPASINHSLHFGSLDDIPQMAWEGRFAE